MNKIVVMYPSQADQEQFESRFLAEHVPLARKLPGLVKIESARIKTGPETPSPAAFMAELYFKDKDSLKAALKSPEMGACAADMQAHVPTGSWVYISDEIRD